MESDATLAGDPPTPRASSLQDGPYRVTGRAGLFAGVEILTAAHELTGDRVILRRLLPLPSLPPQEASLRLRAFQEDTRRRQTLSDPRHLPLFDFAQNPTESGGAYQAFTLPDGARSVPRDPRALPLEEWTRIAAEAGSALDSLIAIGIRTEFHPSGLLIGNSGQVRLVPMDFPWPPTGSDPGSSTRALAGWLYEMLTSAPPPSGAPTSLCDLNPRVSAELDMTVRAAMNPFAVNAVSSPGEFARLLRDGGSHPSPTVSGSATAVPSPTSNLWANAGAWAVLLALGGVTLGWLLALYFPRR